MRFTLGLAMAIGAAAVAAVACGSSADSVFNGGSTDNGTSGGGDNGFGSSGTSGTSGTTGSSEDVDPTSLRIDPADAVINLTTGASKTQAYRVFGKKKNSST